MLKRINLNLPEELVAQVDEQASKCNITRTAYIALSLSRSVQQEQTIAQMPQMLDTLNRAIDESIASRKKG